MNLELISTIVGVFSGSGILVAGLGFAYAQYKRGSSEADAKTISSLKEYIVTLEEKNKRLSDEKSQLITSHQTQLTELNKSLGILQGRFDEQTKQIDMYKQLLQGRDPEQVKVLHEIKALLSTVNIRSKTNQTRNESLDGVRRTTRRIDKSNPVQ